VYLTTKEKTMDTEEREAFIKSYGNNVAHYSAEEVRAFLIAYKNATPETVPSLDDVYNQNECSASVTDSLWVWGDAIRYSQKCTEEFIQSCE
jgi:hypothetical protein